MPEPVRRPWALWVPLILFLAIVAAALWGLALPRDRVVHSALVGKRLPPIALPAATNDRPGIAADTLRPGRPRMLNIFASWCVPCRVEAPQLRAISERGIDIVGVALKDDRQDLARFLAENGNPFSAIGADRSGSVQLALGSSGVPESYLIAADGTIIEQHVGDIRPEQVDAIVARLKAAR